MTLSFDERPPPAQPPLRAKHRAPVLKERAHSERQMSAQQQRSFHADLVSTSSTPTSCSLSLLSGASGASPCESHTATTTTTTMPTLEEERRMRARAPTMGAMDWMEQKRLRMFRSVEEASARGSSSGPRPPLEQAVRKRGEWMLFRGRSSQFPAAVMPPFAPPPPPPFAFPRPPLLERFDSFSRSTPLRRDFSVDRRTDSLFRSFVRPDPFELL